MGLSPVVSDIFNVEKCRDLEIRIKGHSKSSKMISFNAAPMTSVVTIGLSRTVSEINGDFSRKSAIFPTPCTYSPLKLGNRAGSEETSMMGLPDSRNFLKIVLAVLIQYLRVSDS